MGITAAEVTKLRQVTGAGMMDCKKALTDANGDFDEAIKIIREKGKAIANKRADRLAGEGVALATVSADKKFGVLTVLNCETDFVAKNDDFIKRAEKLNAIALAQKPANIDALKTLKVDGTVISDVLGEMMSAIAEKIDLSYYEGISAEMVVPYIHPGNKIATLVGFSKVISEQVGRDIAMQVAAMNPVAVDKSSVSKEVIEREIEIGKEQARNECKPEEMLEKIALGKLNKFYKESTLVEQAFIKDQKKTVAQHLAEHDKEAKVTAFLRFSLND